MASTYLLVIGDARGLAWILRERRMAFPARSRGVGDIAKGDRLIMMTTRSCFRSPARDRTRIVGLAHVDSKLELLNKPLKLAGRTFDRVCDLNIERLAPFRTGIELQPLVAELDAFPDKHAWSWRLRRPALLLSAKDAALLTKRVDDVSGVPATTIPGYLEWIDAHPRSAGRT